MKYMAQPGAPPAAWQGPLVQRRSTSYELNNPPRTQKFGHSQTTGNQTHRPADARVQDLSLRAHPDRRHRDHAHDSQRSARTPQRARLVASRSVLFAGLLIAFCLTAPIGLIGILRQNRLPPFSAADCRHRGGAGVNGGIGCCRPLSSVLLALPSLQLAMKSDQLAWFAGAAQR